MNIDNILNDIDLDIGTTKRMDCPSCKGKNTFTITNNMGSVLFNCYKASCVVSGTRRVNLTVDQIKKSKQDTVQDKKFVLPEYIVPIKEDRFNNPIGGLTWKEKIWRDYCLNDVKENRVVFPIHQKGKTVDAIGRSLGKRLPKWRKYGSSGLPFTFGCGSVAVVVEDCLSALCIGSEVYVGVAVLGTTLTDIHKRYLSQFSTTIIALDPDALPKTMQFAKELRGHVNTVKVLRLTDDLKYRKEEDLINLNLLTPKGEPTWN